MGKLRWLGFLMGFTVLAVTGFQLYWLKQNYAREKKSLNIKSEMAFREAILQLQVDKFKMNGVNWSSDSSGDGKIKIITENKDGRQVNIRVGPRQEITSINVLRTKLKDSLKIKGALKKGMVISLNKTSLGFTRDSTKFKRIRSADNDERGNHVFQLLYGVDSLQEPIRLPEIDSALAVEMVKEKINVPYTVTQLPVADDDDHPRFNQVTVGLTNPVTYKLELGNTAPYLLKQIVQPILFSIFLSGITILSFVLLYRNLLKQQRLAEVKNEFIGNITHELKTPIATVNVAIEALKNFNAMDNPARTREYLDISQNELQRLSLLVDKVLKLSMFEKKEVELKIEMLNLEGVVNEVVSSLKLQLEKNRSRVTVNREGDVNLQGDRLHLLSVVFNLLDNAIKYSKGEAVIDILLKEEAGSVLLEVKDNGIGIPAEYKDKLFDKFFRVPHGDTHNAKGYGLGLSYVAQVVRKHRGTIGVESKPGAGSAFLITLPKTQAGNE